MSLIPWRKKENDRKMEVSTHDAMRRWRDEMDEMLTRFWTDPFDALSVWKPTGAKAGGMSVDVSESDTDIEVKMDAPGVEEDDLHVSVHGNVLTIRGEKKEDRTEKERDYHFVERRFGSFSRSVELPPTVDPEKVDATFCKGVLTIKIAKTPEGKSTRIPVTSS